MLSRLPGFRPSLSFAAVSPNITISTIPMGTWSEDTFGNDTACDWIGSFLNDPGLEAIEDVIDNVLATEDDYLDSDEACECLAACEVLARWQGQWGIRNSYSVELDRWIEQNPTPVPRALKVAADSAIERILGPDSELPALWDEGGRNEKWNAVIDDLRRRIKA